MTPEKREELRAAVLTKTCRNEDYSVLRFIVYSTIFVVLACNLFFGSLFIGIALFGKGEWADSVSGIVFFFFLSLAAAFLHFFKGPMMRKFIPREIQLLRSVLVITLKDGTVVRIPYNHCRWSMRTCFAFYGYNGFGLSRKGLLFYLPVEKMEKFPLLPVPLTPEEKPLWVEKLQVSCEETKPSYLRMLAILMIPICAFVPAFLGIGLIRLSVIPPTLSSIVFFTSSISGPLLGAISVPCLASAPNARFLAIKPFQQFVSRWGATFGTVLVGLAFPLYIAIGSVDRRNADLPAKILWCVIFWVLMMVMTGSLSNLLYRSKRKRKDRRDTFAEIGRNEWP